MDGIIEVSVVRKISGQNRCNVFDKFPSKSNIGPYLIFYLHRYDERSRDYQSCFCCCNIFWKSFKLDKAQILTDPLSLVMSVSEP